MLRRSGRLRGLRLLVPLLLTLGVLGLYSVQLRDAKHSADRRMGYSIERVPGGLQLSDLTPGEPAAANGLQDGDLVIAIDGRRMEGFIDYDTAAEGFVYGEEVSFRIVRGDRELEIWIAPGGPVDWTVPLVRGLVMLACLVLAVVTAVRSPRDLRGRLLTIFLLLLAIELSLPGGTIGNVALEILLGLLLPLHAGAQIGVELHLASLIPERRRWLARRPWVVPLYYALGVGMGAVVSATYLVEEVLAKSWLPWGFSAAEEVFQEVGFPIWAGAVLILLGIPALRHAERQGRQQARLVLLSFLPWTAYVFWTSALNLLGRDVPAWIDFVFPLLLLAFPLAIWAVMELELRSHRRILLSLAQGIRQRDSIEEISELVAKELDTAFRPTCAYVFFQEEQTEELTLGYSTGSQEQVRRAPAHFELLAMVEKSEEAFVYPRDLEHELPEEERRWLRRLGVRIVVPVSDNRHGLLGLLLLGDKRSEEAYSDHDLRLLDALAGQIALSFEILGLRSRLQEKHRIQREVLTRLQDREINLVKECPSCGACYDSALETCGDDGAALELSVPVERTIGERYRLDRVLGKGGIGAVYGALDLRLDRPVAVKVLLGSVLDRSHVQRRFEREARVIAQLDHANVVKVYDYGQTATGNAFIALELLEGVSLRQVFRRGPQTPEALVSWLAPVLRGLAAAHARGVVHRDLKPGNVVISGNPRGGISVKLLDFGIAKVRESAGRPARNLTAPGAVLGTLGYMSPEQVLGDEVDERADIYSLGVMVLEALLGRRPFRGRTPMDVMTSVSGSAIDLPGDGPEVAQLEEILRRCLRRAPADRYPSVEALEKVLIPALSACSQLVPGDRIDDLSRVLSAAAEEVSTADAERSVTRDPERETEEI